VLTLLVGNEGCVEMESLSCRLFGAGFFYSRVGLVLNMQSFEYNKYILHLTHLSVLYGETVGLGKSTVSGDIYG
jgi:hypothetical protein